MKNGISIYDFSPVLYLTCKRSQLTILVLYLIGFSMNKWHFFSYSHCELNNCALKCDFTMQIQAIHMYMIVFCDITCVKNVTWAKNVLII